MGNIDLALSPPETATGVARVGNLRPTKPQYTSTGEGYTRHPLTPRLCCLILPRRLVRPKTLNSVPSVLVPKYQLPSDQSGDVPNIR